METTLQLSRSKIMLCLVLIIGISLGLKLYSTDFSLPVNSDNLLFTLHAIAHTNGDFSQTAHVGMGWSLFVSPFFSLIDSDNFIDYSNIIRVISLSLATCSIPEKSFIVIVEFLIIDFKHLNFQFFICKFI